MKAALAISLLSQPLVLPVVVPLVAGVICYLLPRGAQTLRAWLAVATSAATLVLVWPLFTAADTMLDIGASARNDTQAPMSSIASAVVNNGQTSTRVTAEVATASHARSARAPRGIR